MMLSCSAALNPFMTLIPPNVSVSLPVTSAFILPRALKIGRIILNALRAITANIPKGISVNKVIEGLICNKSTSETRAVIVPPTN